MRVQAVVLAISTLVAGAQAVPRTSALVDAVTNYVSQYQQEFVSLVADEHVTQRVTVRGAVTATRESGGELFSAFVDDAGTWMSVHDIQIVDGEPVVGRRDVRALLRSQSFRDVGRLLAAENARFNLGHVSRNFNEPTLALLLFTRTHVRNLSVDRDARPAVGGGTALVTLRVKLPDDAPLVRSLTRRVTTRGTFIVEPGGRIHETAVRFDDGEVTAELKTLYAFDAHVDVWVPVTFTERYTDDRTREITDVKTTVTNYRRFQTSGRVVE
ncbi:MAG: hypothetical protein ABI634_17220 [Acidobacteriota bacterium]